MLAVDHGEKRPKGSLPLLKGACVDDDSILQNVDLAKTTAQHRLARAIKKDAVIRRRPLT